MTQRQAARVAGALLLAAAARAASAAAPEPLPPMFYDEAADAACAREQGTPVQPAWAAELRDALPRLNALWQSTAPALFEAVARLTKGGVQPQAVPVRLTLCGIPSQSLNGVIVNMRFALRAFTPEPVPLRVKVDTAVHETLHLALSGFDPVRSRLLAAHGSEPACVRNHLHLLSLQKAALLDRGQQAEFEQLVAVDAQLPSGCYRRAWAIVNATADSHQAYVRELSGAP